MPSPATLERFVDLVERNAHDQAIADFYTEDASMQENNAPPRVGRDRLVAHERQMLARAASVSSRCIRPLFVSGDLVVVRWQFRFVWLDGKVTEMEELAYQHWAGERIREERFFYDPAQLAPRSPAP